MKCNHHVGITNDLEKKSQIYVKWLYREVILIHVLANLMLLQSHKVLKQILEIVKESCIM